ncbi:Ankyrin-3 [Fusarium odoratissimum]|uniref:protein S-acyltransferase n=1 Tax=Fusarium oxysporum f. sp. cubense (strain race 4) TaxID=2502994 RepID=N1S1L5_FUSC4|nr:Ankyrin-3 [Fusarium odoratissimum]
MEVTGLAVGVVGLAGLFSVCLDSLSRFQSYRESNFETHVLDTRFRAARARFEQWGISVGISNGRLQPDHHDGLDNKETAALIESILQIIAKTICDKSILQRTHTRPRFQSGQFGGLSQSRSERLKWALGGKESRNEQVDIFEKLVQQLYNLISPEEKSQNYKGLESTAWVEDICQMLTKIEEGINKRLDTTCEWIFNRSKFKSWLSPADSSKPSLLWINGPAGFGKTVLSAHIVHRLSEALDTPVAHFFFTSDHESRDDPFAALRSWQCQVAAKNNDAFECIRGVWESDSSEKASRRTIVDLFKQVITAAPGCVFIADGLDECSQLGNGDTSVARLLRDIMYSIHDANVRLLLISRDEPEIRETLEENGEILSEYRIGTDDVGADTAAFSQSVVDKKLSNKSEDVRLAISETMAARCEGQFLWIKMQEQSLRNGMSKKRLCEVVENTPSGLDRLYDHNWKRIMEMPDWDRDRAFALLRWSAFTFRPLTVFAVTEAVLITQFQELDPDEYPENVNDEYIRTEIIGLCGPLLEVHDHSQHSSPGNRTLNIPHFSVRQYLVENLPAPAWMQANDILNKEYESLHHTAIARACVQYLSLPQVWEKDGQHDHLIDDADVNEIGALGRSPIFSACHSGSAESVNLLIRRGADLSITDSQGVTCLHIAAACGFEDIVRILVESKVKLSPQDHRGRTPLHLASTRGHIKCYQYLLEQGADVNIRDKWGGNVVHYACIHGQAELLRFILRNAPDNFATDHSYRLASPLILASQSGNVDMAKLLFEHGAVSSLFITETLGNLPLHYAASNGHAELLGLFLEHGKTITTPYLGGETPLYAAATKNHAEVLKLLLEVPDVSVNQKTTYGFTPLFIASRNGYHDIVELLLSTDSIDKDSESWLGLSPLFAAVANGHLEVTKLLLSKGAHLQLSVSIGRDLLWWAQRSNKPDLIQLLKTQEAITGTASDSCKPLPGPFANIEPLSRNAKTVDCTPGVSWCYVCTLSVQDERYFQCQECHDSYMFLCSECFSRGFHLCLRSHVLVPLSLMSRTVEALQTAP